MNMPDTLRGALRRIVGPSFLKLHWPVRRLPSALQATSAESARRTVPLPSIFAPGAPTLVRAGVMPKPTPANLRRFAEMPIARKAINTIKDRIAGMQWRIQPRHGRSLDDLPDATERIATLVLNFEQPNPEDSFRSFIEQILEDVLVGGFGAIELDLSGDPAHPLVMWPVDGASIRIRSDWDGNPTSPHYVQATAAFLPDQDISLTDEELSYIRLNPRTHTPFGLGKLEVAFETIHEFLCAHRFASRLASNSVVQYALWLQGLSPQHHERLIRWWQDEIEGTGKVPILSVETKPESASLPTPSICRLCFWAWSATSIATLPALSRMMLFAPPSSPSRASSPNTSLATPSASASVGTIWSSFSPTWMRLTNWNRRKSSKSSSAAACLPSTRSAA